LRLSTAVPAVFLALGTTITVLKNGAAGTTERRKWARGRPMCPRLRRRSSPLPHREMMTTGAGRVFEAHPAGPVVGVTEVEH
jgi:hypothetical protein